MLRLHHLHFNFLHMYWGGKIKFMAGENFSFQPQLWKLKQKKEHFSRTGGDEDIIVVWLFIHFEGVAFVNYFNGIFFIILDVFFFSAG